MTNKNIIHYLEHLPLLPEIVQELIYLQKHHSNDFDKYMHLMNKNSVGSSKILKVANSKPFNFDNYIDSPTQAINLLGMNFASSILMYENIKNSFHIDLEAYGSNALEFDLIALYCVKVMLKWIDETTCTDKDKLVLPMLLNDIGKFVISSALKKEKNIDHFYSVVNSAINLPSIEKESLGVTSSEISAFILKKWSFESELIKTVFYMDNPLDAKENQRLYIQLNVIKTIFNINSPMNKTCINFAFEKLKGLEFNENRLRRILEEIENDFLSEYQKIRK
jgi:HD-like signal output (HDOD) protein